MNKRSRGRESSHNRSSSAIKRNKNRKSMQQSSNGTFELSQIPRAVETPLEPFVAQIFQLRGNKSTHFFQPAESQAEYLQIFNDAVGRWPEPRFISEDDSKEQNIWRCLQRLNNEGNSSNYQDNQSSTDFMKTYKKNTKQTKSLLIPIKAQAEFTPVFPSENIHSYQNIRQLTPPNKEPLKISTLTIKKQFDIKLCPPKIENHLKEEVATQPEYQEIQIQFERKKVRETIEKKRSVMKKQRIVPLHQRRNHRNKNEPDTQIQLVQRKLSSYKPVQMVEVQRANRFELRSSRMKPLKFWLGERISYKNDGNHSIWTIKESEENDQI